MSETNVTAAGPLEPVQAKLTVLQAAKGLVPNKPSYAITEAALVAYIDTLPEA